MKKLFTVLIALILFGVGLFVFYKLGGFSDIEIRQADLGILELSGVYFVGTPTQPELRDAFASMEVIQSKQPNAQLFTLYYREPAGKVDTMEVFVGVEHRFVSEDTLQRLNIDASDVIIATVKAHRYVMPGSSKVKNEIQEYADFANMTKPVFFLDKIISPDEVQVIGLQKADRPL